MRGRFDGLPVVATRFVRACPRGHVDDLDWYGFVHGAEDPCKRQLWLDERGTTGDLSDLIVRCECRKSRSMHEAAEGKALGPCRGTRPWLGRNSELCGIDSRLLIRTASNAYFPQIVSVLSLPDRDQEIKSVITELWDDLQIVETKDHLSFLKKKPKINERLSRFSDAEVLDAIREFRGGGGTEKPVKQVELDAILAAQEGFGDDVPVNPDFHARRLPDKAWRCSSRFDHIESVFQLHRLREVIALIGFTRLEPETPDINGEYDSDVKRAEIALEPQWFPAGESRRGNFIRLRGSAVKNWLGRPAVKNRSLSS